MTRARLLGLGLLAAFLYGAWVGRTPRTNGLHRINGQTYLFGSAGADTWQWTGSGWRDLTPEWKP